MDKKTITLKELVANASNDSIVVDEAGNPIEVKVEEAVASTTEAPKAADIAEVVRKAIKEENAENANKSNKRFVTVQSNETRAIKSYKGKAFGSGEEAYDAGMFLASLGSGPFARFAADYCDEKGLSTKGMTEGSNINGAYSVYPEFSSRLIDIVLSYGKFRQNCDIEEMASDSKSVLRRTAGTTAYAINESTSITESNPTYDRVLLVAKKWGVLTKVSNELSSDSVLNHAERFALEAGRSMAKAEDDCGFNGDGTSTYNGITGIRQKLIDVFTSSGGTGLTQGAGSTWASLTLANFNTVVGTLPDYAEADAKWYCSKAFWGSTMQRLLTAAGGINLEEIVNGQRVPKFLGYDVVLCNSMPSAPASGAVPVVFGDLKQASTMGSRTLITLAQSDSHNSAFATDEFYLRATERFDIVTHDVGVSGTAGPVVGLITQ